MNPVINYKPDLCYYRPTASKTWTGRIDGDREEHLRWHQKITCLDLSSRPLNTSAAAQASVVGERIEASARPIVLLGFACDEGVRRNQGRVGAARGPEALRKALSNLPVHESELVLWDAGDITCTDGRLEMAQRELAQCLSALLSAGALPIVLGGGHEVTFGHYSGIRHFLDGATPKSDPAPRAKLGIINFDAHFDNRQPGIAGPSSGTGFWQIEPLESPNFRYLALGIQRTGNTKALFDRADLSGTEYIMADDFHHAFTKTRVQQFCQTVDHVYVTIDLDVFSAAHAPGVSAPSAWGISPDAHFLNVLQVILKSGKLCSMDLAELNPPLDQDQRTAKLAAHLIDYVIAHVS